MENIHYVYFENLLASLEETHSITVGPRGLVTIKVFHHLEDFFFFEWSLQPNGLLPQME